MDFLPSDAQIVQIAMLVLPIAAVVMLYGYRHEIMAAGRRVVGRYLARTAYVTHEGDGAADDDRVFPHSRQEAEAEVGRKLAPGSADGMLVITQVAHEAQLDAAFEEGMVKAFAAMHKGGYLMPGKATEVKRLLFGVGGGRALQNLNKAIDAVAVELDVKETPAPEPEQRLTPLAGRPIAPDLEFAGELSKD
jgi:hypothetical protein